MRAGKLDREITLERVAIAADAYGVPQETWTPIAALRAQLVQASTEEFRRGYGASSETIVVFRTRFIDGVTPADRIVYAGQHHDIKEVKEIGRRRGLELRTIARGAS